MRQPAPVRRSIWRRNTLTRQKHNTGLEEWYTPDFILTAVRCLFDIDLDPASSIVANESVNAAKIYTKDDDGLIQPWEGNIFLNPPYARGVVGKFADKLVMEYKLGHVKQAISLTNAITDTKAGQKLLSNASAICFIAGRLNFKKYGEVGTAGNPQGQMICYFGKYKSGFKEIFSKLGTVMMEA